MVTQTKFTSDRAFLFRLALASERQFLHEEGLITEKAILAKIINQDHLLPRFLISDFDSEFESLDQIFIDDHNHFQFISF
jgi:hypothetical protein